MSSDITGKLKKVIWRSLENDFTIAAFINTENQQEFIATGDLFKLTGGLIYSMSGKWQDHAKYGKQFKIDNYCIQEPVDTISIIAFLEKHVKGIGPEMAERLVEKYGKQTIKILKGAPERVGFENKGLSYKNALKISEQLNENDKRQDILIKLEGLFSKVKGLPKRLAQDVMKIYGLTAYEVIKNNPYQLIEMNRIGFIQADKVAMSCGVNTDDKQRIRAGVLYAIRQSMQESGDIWLKPGLVGNSLLKLIGGLKPTMVIDVILKLVEDKILVKHEGYITLTQFADDEDLICDCVRKFLI
jgi:exodeoxyribonuclease V alpha subunit